MYWHVCRLAGVAFATLYLGLAFRAGLHDNKLSLLLNCIVAASFITTTLNANQHIKNNGN